MDGTMTTTGKPILANDPHRPVQIPSLRKTVHLVGPGWNAIGAGEPALPGIALGHNEQIGFGFTIVGIDQQDLYVEKLNPSNPDEYLYKGAWKKLEIERQTLKVKGRAPLAIELRYTIHGPVIHEDRARNRVYALRWVGSEPGAAGYLAGLALARASNWDEFLRALERYLVPSENVVYVDRAGNIGWQAAGLTPIRKNWNGLFPLPGDSGIYEWSGFRTLSDLPRAFNPPSHFIATANNNILPSGHSIPLGYEWAQPFRVQRIREMLSVGRKFSVKDCEQMQQDVTSIPARCFQGILRQWKPKPVGRAAQLVERLLEWDARLTADSAPALIYEVWISELPKFVFGAEIGPLTDLTTLLTTLESSPNPKALGESLDAALKMLDRDMGSRIEDWKWGRVHQIDFQHPILSAKFNRGPVPRPGDSNTVNATGGSGFHQTNGASYRHILDLSDWDHSVMTNVPGESGNPESAHYSDLLDEWASGSYHPMPFSRKAVEAATVERITLVPK
jgi:penicillin amidase